MLPALALTAVLLAQDAAIEAPPGAPILSINPSCWLGPGWITTAWPNPRPIELPKGDSLPTWQRVGWTIPAGWAHLTGDLGELCAHRSGAISRFGIPGVSGWPPDRFRLVDGSRWVDGLGLVLLSGWIDSGGRHGMVVLWDGAGSVRTWWLEGFLPGAVELVRPGLLALLEGYQAEPITALGCLDLVTGRFWRVESGPSLRWGRAVARVGAEVWVSAMAPDGIQVYTEDLRWLRTIPADYPVEALLVHGQAVYSRSVILVERRDFSGTVTAAQWLPVPGCWTNPPYSLAWDDRDGGHLIGQFNIASDTGPWLLCHVDADLSGRYEAADPYPGLIGPIHPWRQR